MIRSPGVDQSSGANIGDRGRRLPPDVGESGSGLERWRKWNRFDWSEALLNSYFGRQPDGESEPVRILVVTDDQLCRVVGENVVAPEQVRLSLIEKTRRSVGETNFWQHASEQRGEKPSYVAHLIVACIAAIDCSDVDERSYLKRLQEIAGPSAEHSIELMPKLWLRLHHWLAERTDEYRPLILPDPRGWVRIGHTTRLAFPSRADQTKLRELLAEQDFEVDEVPLGAVLRALVARRRGFSTRFRDELDAFEQGLRSGVPAADLFATPLWSAVVNASSLDVEDQQADPAQRWTVIGVDDGYELDLRVVTNGEAVPAPFHLGDCDEPYGSWTRELLTSEDDPAVRAVLTDKSLHIGSVSRLVRGGVIPLVEAAHGALQIASKQDFEFVKIAVVAVGCADEIQRRFGGSVSAPSNGVPGWNVMRNVRLRTAASEEFEGSVLERCWILHDTPFPASLRLIGGVRIGDAYLGKRSTLPRLRAAEATRVTSTTDGVELELQAEEHGDWSFPVKGSKTGIEGIAVLRAYFASGDRERQVRFVRSPSTEVFKAPGDLSAWQIEGAARSQSMSSTLEMYADELQPALANVSRVTRLGRDVGVFASEPHDTTWEIEAFGSSRDGRLTRPVEHAVPTHRSPSDGDRRRWRKTLAGAQFDDGDPAGGVARSIVASRGTDEHLPEVPADGPAANGGLVPCHRVEHPSVQDLVEIMCAMANRTAGIEPAIWRRLCQETLGLDWEKVRAVTRAWSEAHLLDETVSRRWSTRKVVFVRPHLVAFQTDRWVRASLQGLALGVTRLRLKEAGAAASVLTETVRSRSGLVPEAVALRAKTLQQIDSVARKLELPVLFLRHDPFRVVAGRDVTTAKPGRYERSTYGQRDDFDGVTVDRWWRSGSPGVWTVSSNAYGTWTHYESAADFWASAFADRPIVRLSGGSRLVRDGAYLPLSAARWLNAVAPVLSGPDPDEPGLYQYECPSDTFREELLTGLIGFIRHQKTALATINRTE